MKEKEEKEKEKQKQEWAERIKAQQQMRGEPSQDKEEEPVQVE